MIFDGFIFDRSFDHFDDDDRASLMNKVRTHVVNNVQGARKAIDEVML